MSKGKNRLLKKELLFSLIPSLLLGIYAILLAILLFHAYVRMDNKNIEDQEINVQKEADYLAFFLEERQKEISQYAQDPFVLAYFKNKALGIGYSIGLSQNILAIDNEFSLILEKKTYLNGKSIYKSLVLFDDDGNLVTKIGHIGRALSFVERLISSTKNIPRFLPNPYSDSLFILSPCTIRGKKVGWLSGTVSWQEILTLHLNSIPKRWMDQNSSTSKGAIGILYDEKCIISFGNKNFMPEFFEDILKRYFRDKKECYHDQFSFNKEEFIAFLTPVKKTSFYFIKLYPKCEITHIYQIGLLFGALIFFGVILSVWLIWAIGKALQSTLLKSEVQKAEELSKVKSEFLSYMSHEIRTPLNGLIGALSLLKAEKLGEESRHYLEIAIRSGNHLLALIDNILNISRLEYKKVTAQFEPFEPIRLVEDIADLGVGLIGQRPIRLYSYSNCPQRVLGDEARISQILLNLLGNAAKYTSSGWIKIEGICGKKDDSAFIVFSIQDTGCGIPDEIKEKIFAPFERGEEKREKISGTGLGLFIVKHLVDTLNGEISVYSSEQGTKFQIKVPIGLIEKEKKDVLPKRYKILLVIKDRILQEIVKNYLINWHQKVLILDSLKRPTSKKIDFLIGDSNGLLDTKKSGLLEKLRKGDGFKTIEIRPLGFSKEEGINVISDITLTSPFKGSQLLKILQRKGPLLKEIDRKGELEINLPQELKCLLVEDNEFNQMITRSMLKKMGISTVDIAENGQKALELFKKNYYDFIIMDCQMPIMDGFEATLKIREIERERNLFPTKIIALSAQVSDKIRARCKVTGMDFYLSKPIKPALLKETLVKIIKKKPEKEF